MFIIIHQPLSLLIRLDNLASISSNKDQDTNKEQMEGNSSALSSYSYVGSPDSSRQTSSTEEPAPRYHERQQQKQQPKRRRAIHTPTYYRRCDRQSFQHRETTAIRRLGAGPCRGPLDSPNRSLTDPRHLPDTAPAGAHL